MAWEILKGFWLIVASLIALGLAVTIGSYAGLVLWALARHVAKALINFEHWLRSLAERLANSGDYGAGEHERGNTRPRPEHRLRS
jgi:hypothetical protein